MTERDRRFSRLERALAMALTPTLLIGSFEAISSGYELGNQISYVVFTPQAVEMLATDYHLTNIYDTLEFFDAQQSLENASVYEAEEEKRRKEFSQILESRAAVFVGLGPTPPDPSSPSVFFPDGYYLARLQTADEIKGQEEIGPYSEELRAQTEGETEELMINYITPEMVSEFIEKLRSQNS